MGKARVLRRGEIKTVGFRGEARLLGARLVKVLNEAVTDSGDGIIFGKFVENNVEFGFGPPIVGIEEGDDGSARLADGEIVGGDLAAVGFAEVLDARREFCSNGFSIVSRAV